MAKAGFWLNGAKGTLAGSVVAPSPQGTIIREKVTPSNPRTQAQVEQRAKLKLVSQLSAVMAPVLAIPREKGLTSRNIFVRKNISNVIAENGVASAILDNIQITNSNVGLSGVQVSREPEASMGTARLADSSSFEDLSRVVYTVFLKNSEGKLILVDNKIVDKGASEDFATDIYLPNTGDCVIYAYGAKDLNTKATATYKNYKVKDAQDFASLFYTRKLSTTDMRLTETRGTELRQGQNESVIIPEGYVAAYLGIRGGAGTWSISQRENSESEWEELAVNNGVALFKRGYDVMLEFTAASGYRLETLYDVVDQYGLAGSGVICNQQSSTIDMVAICQSVMVNTSAAVKNTASPTDEIDFFGIGGFEDLALFASGEFQSGTVKTLTVPQSFTHEGVSLTFQGWQKDISSLVPSQYDSTSNSITIVVTEGEHLLTAWYSNEQ